ncbi:MAG: lytic transglycosylase domain-containing protein [Bacilli bacterium]
MTMNVQRVQQQTQALQTRNTTKNTQFSETLERVQSDGLVAKVSDYINPNLNALSYKELVSISQQIAEMPLTNVIAPNVEQTMNIPSDISNASMPSLYDDIISEMASKHNVDPLLIKSIIKHESNFNPDVVSSAGAVGLMQLMPITAEATNVTDRRDVRQNIEGGTKYIRRMLDKYDGNLTLALAGYNAGPGNVAKYGGVPPFKETENYIRKVTTTYDALRSQTL